VALREAPLRAARHAVIRPRAAEIEVAARLHELAAQQVVALLRPVVVGRVEDEQHRLGRVELLLVDDPTALHRLVIGRRVDTAGVPLLREAEASRRGPQVEPRVAPEVRQGLLARGGVQMIAPAGNDFSLPCHRLATAARPFAEEVVECGEARHGLQGDARHRDRIGDAGHAVAVGVPEAQAQRRPDRSGVAGRSSRRIRTRDRARGRRALDLREPEDPHGRLGGYGDAIEERAVRDERVHGLHAVVHLENVRPHLLESRLVAHLHHVPACGILIACAPHALEEGGEWHEVGGAWRLGDHRRAAGEQEGAQGADRESE